MNPNSASLIGASSPLQAPPPAPVVGDKFLFRVETYGGMALVNTPFAGQFTQDGATYIEVEVTAVKKARVVIE